jgi:hypothetical protein
MEEVLKMSKEKKIKYDYSNPESQEIFAQTVVLLSEIVKYREKEFSQDVNHFQNYRSRDLIREIVSRLKMFFVKKVLKK